MRYSTESRKLKYVEGYTLLSFARKFGDNYRKKLMHTTVKTRIDATKTTSKRVIQKTAEATGNLIGNKIVNKSISAGKTKIKGKKKRKRNKWNAKHLHTVWNTSTNYWCFKILGTV